MNSLPRILNFIAGRLQPALSKAWLANIQPSTGKIYSETAASGAGDIEAAVESAAAAFPSWANAGTAFRARCLNRLADLVEARLEAFAQAESRDAGKPIVTARTVDIPRAIANLRFFAGAIQHWSGESHFMEAEPAVNYTLRQPVGPVACISPWNLPLYLFTWKVAPALAAGCTVVGKPSEVTPMTAFLLSELINEAGFPPGVFNIVHGSGPDAGQALVTHPGIKAVSFTGGTQTGKQIAAATAHQLKKLSLELGGKNPFIVFEDADIQQTVKQALRAGFSNTGQICLCGSRLYVARSIYDDFKDALVSQAANQHVGDPLSEATRLGALSSEAHYHKVLGYIDLALEEGGTLLHGGQRLQLPGELEGGYFMSPAIIEGLGPQARCNQEEIFGPVITLQPFDSEEEVIQWANNTPYGLAASVWTRDAKRAQRVSQALEFGIVWVNCWMLRDLRTPFGGVKGSGIGREGGWEALRFFTEAKNVCMYYGE